MNNTTTETYSNSNNDYGNNKQHSRTGIEKPTACAKPPNNNHNNNNVSHDDCWLTYLIATRSRLVLSWRQLNRGALGSCRFAGLGGGCLPGDGIVVGRRREELRQGWSVSPSCFLSLRFCAPAQTVLGPTANVHGLFNHFIPKFKKVYPPNL